MNKILLDEDDVATGVRFVPRGGDTSFEVRARKEVVLSTGAIHTPQVLQLSGIGPAGLLESAGIDVKVGLPGVGANFQDHPIGPAISFRCKFRCSLPCVLIAMMLTRSRG